MLGKLIDGRLVVAGERIIEGRTVITRPTVEKLKELGYKEIEYTEKPQYDKEEEKLQEIYTDGDKITVSYEVVELSAEEHNAIIQQEIIAEENKITKRRQREIDLNIENAREFEQQIENNIVELRAKLREIEQVEE